MAEILDDFDFTRKSGRKSRYPWNEWLDGQTRKLRRGEDFPGAADHFRKNIYAAARDHNVPVQTRLINEDEIVLRAVRD